MTGGHRAGHQHEERRSTLATVVFQPGNPGVLPGAGVLALVEDQPDLMTVDDYRVHDVAAPPLVLEPILGELRPQQREHIVFMSHTAVVCITRVYLALQFVDALTQPRRLSSVPPLDLSSDVRLNLPAQRRAHRLFGIGK